MYTPQAGNNIQTAVDSSHTLTSAFSEASGGIKNKKAKLEDHKFTKTKEFSEKLNDAMSKYGSWGSIAGLAGTLLGGAFLGPVGAAALSGVGSWGGSKLAANKIKDDMSGMGFTGNLDKIMSDFMQNATKQALVSAVATGIGTGAAKSGGEFGKFGFGRGGAKKGLSGFFGKEGFGASYLTASSGSKTILDTMLADKNLNLSQPTYSTLIK